MGKKSEWSDRKRWIMTIVGTVIGALVLAVITVPIINFFRPTLSERERTAVFSLINDIKDQPLYITVFYQKPHSFISNEWRKVRSSDTYYESREVQVNILQFGYAVGKYGDSLGFLEPKYGQLVGKIRDFDVFERVKGLKEARGTAERLNPPLDKNEELDLSTTYLYSTEGSLLPTNILAYADNNGYPKRDPRRAGYSTKSRQTRECEEDHSKTRRLYVDL